MADRDRPARRPMHGNYGADKNPFQAFVEPRDAGLQRELERDRRERGIHVYPFNEGPFDLRGKSEWSTLFTWDTRPFQWGSLWCDVQANDRTAGATADIARAWAEVQVLSVTGGVRAVVCTAPLGSYAIDAGLNASGNAPMRLTFGLGEVPDGIEVQARAYRAGSLMTDINASEVLSLSATGRFYR